MTPLAALAVAGCLAVSPAADRITAADLALAVPGLAIPAGSVPIALAPAPGVQRIFHVPELRRLADRFQWNIVPESDVCIERPAFPPDPARILEAMQRSLPQATITVREYSRQLVPQGEMEFPAAGLRPGGLWMGYVRYAGSRRCSVWARVQAVVKVTRVIAAADLRTGQAIDSGELRLETLEEFPAPGPFLESVDDAAGKLPRGPIRAGTALQPGMLRAPKDVFRGDSVRVHVSEGAAHLELDGLADASGSAGETIPVLNPVSHKRFPARVEGKGRVSVGAAPKVN